jgi:hypothetical protein
VEALAFEAYYGRAAMTLMAHTSLCQLERYAHDDFGICLGHCIKLVRMPNAVELLPGTGLVRYEGRSTGS